MNRRAFMKLLSIAAAGSMALLPTPAKAAEMGVDMASGKDETVTMTFNRVDTINTANVAYYVVVNGEFMRLKTHGFLSDPQTIPGWEFLNDPEEDVYDRHEFLLPD